MKIAFTLLCIPFFLDLHAQTKEYKNLLSVAFGKYDHVMVYKIPTPVSFHTKNVLTLAKNFKRYYHKDVDTVLLLQIIQNAQHSDTTEWAEEELPRFLLVSSRTESISIKQAVHKLSLTDKQQLRSLKRQIRRFNLTDAYDRDISYFSRPVFDNSKSFAIIRWSDAHSGLGGGGGLVLYQRTENDWVMLGELESWKY
jgi:hypothetical protein